ncbi:hypothetical protein EVJ50_06670 [Synechococcus sp. RSCCF101]|uniref:Npun_F0494 family protein n=1 Tax=Synechococcus sp. RSCCF101 TaxID=2511069 RepID=UPI001247E221|nr:Npun_F0494 family protein [Synechococcus sp. RSCCF101]QEY31966.1 hypothetical protein EVJ50_06670 [Synechococcus sp. RSCCF101]
MSWASPSLRRASEALRCLPFTAGFYRRVAEGPLRADEICGDPALCSAGYSASQVDDDLIWLIRLGVLRREVDGQGLTERVRLTPLGRELLQHWPEGWPPPGPLMRLRQGLRRRWPRL